VLELTGAGLGPVHSSALHGAASAKLLAGDVGLSAARHCGGSWVTQISLAHGLCGHLSPFSSPELLEFSKETVISGEVWAIPGSKIHMEGGGRRNSTYKLPSSLQLTTIIFVKC